MKYLLLLTPLLMAMAPVGPSQARDLHGAAVASSMDEETSSVTLDITGMT